MGGNVLYIQAVAKAGGIFSKKGVILRAWEMVFIAKLAGGCVNG